MPSRSRVAGAVVSAPHYLGLLGFLGFAGFVGIFKPQYLWLSALSFLSYLNWFRFFGFFWAPPARAEWRKISLLAMAAFLPVVAPILMYSLTARGVPPQFGFMGFMGFLGFSIPDPKCGNAV